MATTKELLDAFIKAGVNHYGNLPTGTMAPFAGTTVPDGWLLCNGANVSRTTYSKLFAVIGTKWGAGDGSTTFTLPNCNNRVLEGTTNTSNVGTYLEAGLPNISGVLKAAEGSINNANEWGFSTKASGAISVPKNLDVGNRYGGNYSGSFGTHAYFEATNSNSIYGNASSVQMSSIQTLIIIKV